MLNKKITLATFKKFLKENQGHLYIKVVTDFDSMTDGLRSLNGDFEEVIYDNNGHVENTLSIQGLWIVGGSRDYFSLYQDNTFIGIEVHNCCGKQIIARKAVI